MELNDSLLEEDNEIIIQNIITDDEDLEKNQPDNNIININPLKDKKPKDQNYYLKIGNDNNKEDKIIKKEKNNINENIKGYAQLMNNKKNKNLIKNDYNQNNSHNKNKNFELTNNFELNDKDIENIKQKINFKEENDELDKNDPFGDLSKIIKKKINRNKLTEIKENNYGYSKRHANKLNKINYKSSKNVTVFSLKLNEDKNDVGNHKKNNNYISSKEINIFQKKNNINDNHKNKINYDDEDKKNSYMNIYKNKNKVNNKINSKKNIIKEESDDSLMDIDV